MTGRPVPVVSAFVSPAVRAFTCRHARGERQRQSRETITHREPVLGGDRAPAAPSDLDGAAGLGELGEVAVQRGTSHAAGPHQVGDVGSFLGCRAQSGPERAFGRGGAGNRPGCRRARARRGGRFGGTTVAGSAGASGSSAPRDTSSSAGRRGGEVVDGAGHVVIGDEVRAGAPGRGVLGCGDQELAGRVERVRVPPRGEHALSEDQVHVSPLADAEADPRVHLRAHRALPHRLLGWPLGRGDEGYRDRAAQARDGVGVAHRVGCLVGEFGVLIDDDDQRGHVRRRFPDAPGTQSQLPVGDIDEDSD